MKPVAKKMTQPAWRWGALAALILTVSACGGGGDTAVVAGPAAGAVPAPAPVPVPVPIPPPPPPPAPDPAPPAVQLSVIAGALGGSGYQNGSGAAARMGAVNDLAYEPSGNLILADGRNRKLRRVTPAGAVTDAAAVENLYQSVAVLPDGSIVASDFTRIYRIGTDGVSTIVAGSTTAGNLDGAGAAATLNLPIGLTVAPDGSIYFANAEGHTIRKVSPAGVVTTIAGAAGTAGNADGVGAAATFNRPSGMALSADGTTLLVADYSNHRIRSINLATSAVSHFAGSTSRVRGIVDGAASTARFASPSSIRLIGAAGFVVADVNNSRIRQVTPAGVVSTIAGPTAAVPTENGRLNGPASTARFNFPVAVAVAPDGKIAIAEEGNPVVRILSGGNVSTLAGSSPQYADTNGAVAVARFSGFISAMTVLPDGSLVLAQEGDNNSSRRKLRSVSATGDVGGDAATTEFVYAMASNAAGSVYYMDAGGLFSRSSAGVSTRVAGSTTTGFADGTGLAARFESPTAIAVATDGSVYVAEAITNRIRKVSPLGVVTTLAGDGTAGAVDGTGAAARLSRAFDMVLDSTGNLLVATVEGIRKVTPAGVVTTLSRYGACYSTMAIDAASNLYCASDTNIIRFSATGTGLILIRAPLDGTRQVTVSPASPQLNRVHTIRLLRETATELEFVITDFYEGVILKLRVPK